MEEREQEEARKLLEQANKKGNRKLNIAEGAPIDKATLMNQVTSQPRTGLQRQASPHCASGHITHQA